MGLFRPPLPQVTVEGTVPGLPQFVNEHGVHLSLHTPTGTLLCAGLHGETAVSRQLWFLPPREGKAVSGKR